ncbi:MAG: DUF3866 family protein [Actinomycetota bacterium]
MATFREAKISAIVEARADLVRVRVATPGGEIEACGFPSMLGTVEIGDRVIVNTTGIELGLGTGGVAFLLWNLDGPGGIEGGPGHIMKLRYTPWQMEVATVEAPESPHHERLADVTTIDPMPVVACGLHSQVAGVAGGIKAARPDARVGYLMTDGAALPLAWSRLARDLKDGGLIDVTCTSGHAFGGDYDAVNVFSGLAALRHVGDADVTIVAMGPGIVGTGTALGFTGMEQGQILDATTALNGVAIACLRISFADARPRHHGVSHHTLTALSVAAREACIVAVPALAGEQAEVVERQLAAAGIGDRHRLKIVDGGPGVELLAAKGLAPTSMGRTMDEDPALWLAAAAAGRAAVSVA